MQDSDSRTVFDLYEFSTYPKKTSNCNKNKNSCLRNCCSVTNCNTLVSYRGNSSKLLVTKIKSHQIKTWKKGIPYCHRSKKHC